MRDFVLGGGGEDGGADLKPAGGGGRGSGACRTEVAVAYVLGTRDGPMVEKNWPTVFYSSERQITVHGNVTHIIRTLSYFLETKTRMKSVVCIGLKARKFPPQNQEQNFLGI